MKFGKVEDPGNIDFTLPKDKVETSQLLKQAKGNSDNLEVNVGCAKWNRQDLKNFYPRGTKDELTYYSSQFNTIELNAFFYRIFPPEQVRKWKEKSNDNFKFCPKVPQIISQFKRLKNVEQELDSYIDSISQFEEKLGMCFLQMHPSFAPKSFESLEAFIKLWPSEFELSVELRHADWYSDEKAFSELCHLLQENNITHTITDTAGRRDLIHMRLTTPKCFVRFTGANHKSDYTRLDDWVVRLTSWKESGIKTINFFVHQNLEKESPLLTAHFNKNMNKTIGTQLTIPKTIKKDKPNELF